MKHDGKLKFIYWVKDEKFETDNVLNIPFEKLHRVDGPSVIYDHFGTDGTEFWYKDGKLHREDGPAVTKTDGYQAWCYNHKIHRDNDEPAVILGNGDKMWWVEGRLHREDGPAFIKNKVGIQEYWLNFEKIREEKI